MFGDSWGGWIVLLCSVAVLVDAAGALLLDGRRLMETSAYRTIEVRDGNTAVLITAMLWLAMLGIAGVAILERLVGAGRDVTLLTNFAADTFAQAREMFPFFARARGVTVSGEVGVLKPDAAIYRIHAETFGLDPARTLFIDDSARNVEGARAAGWRGVLFSDARTLEGDLAGYGL